MAYKLEGRNEPTWEKTFRALLWGCESESRRPAQASPDLQRRDRLRWAELGADWLDGWRQAQLGSAFLQGRIRIRVSTPKEATLFGCSGSFSQRRYFPTWTCLQFPHTPISQARALNLPISSYFDRHAQGSGRRSASFEEALRHTGIDYCANLGIQCLPRLLYLTSRITLPEDEVAQCCCRACPLHMYLVC